MDSLAKKVLYINLNKRTYSVESHPDLDKYVGGVGLGLKLYSLYAEIDPIIFSTGPLNGYFPFVSKTSVVLNKGGVIEDIYLGGSLSFRIRFAGIDAIVLAGSAKEQVYLNICDEEVQFIPASEGGIDAQGLPGKRSILKFQDNEASRTNVQDKLTLDNYFSVSEALLDSKFVEKNVRGIAVTGLRTFNIANREKYEDLYKNLLARTGDISVEKSENPSCSGCPMGCLQSRVGEVGGNVLVHSLVACSFAEKIYSDIGIVFSCLNVLGYYYTHEDLENLPRLIQEVLLELAQPRL